MGTPRHVLRTRPVPSDRATANGSSNPVTQVTATVELVKAYARQETVDQFKGMARWLGYGIVGAICVAIGVVLLVTGVLRLVQHYGDDVFYGVWSIVPYLIALVVCLVVVALALSRVKATDVHRQGS
jgi:uncharacterized membrane protein